MKPSPTLQPGVRVKVAVNSQSMTAHLRGEHDSHITGVILQSFPNGSHLVCFSLNNFLVEVTKFPSDLQIA